MISAIMALVVKLFSHPQTVEQATQAFKVVRKLGGF